MANLASFDLTGKTAFVTGGGTGIGYAIALGLAKSGAKVMIAARREPILKEAAEKITAELKCEPVLYRTLDLSDRVNIDAVADHAIAEMGGIDIFVANAGHESNQPVAEITYEAIDATLQVNLSANIALVKKFTPAMRKKQWGRVILIASILAWRGTWEEGSAVYAASKAGLNGYGRVAATELGHDGITVNMLNLGMYHTEMLDAALSVLDPAQVESIMKTYHTYTALGRWGDPEEVAGVVQLLASDAGSYMTGEEIAMDGGFAIMMKPRPKAG